MSDADAIVVTSGGIGANHDLVRAAWPASLGKPPTRMLSRPSRRSSAAAPTSSLKTIFVPSFDA